MATSAVIIETPALDPVGMPIVGVIDYEVNRELNSAGSWAVSFSASQQLATQIKSRWRLSIVEDGRQGFLLYRGVVIDHSYRINSDGSAIVSLQGMTRLYSLMDQSTHQGLAYDGTVDIETIANALTGETVTAPASAPDRMPKVTFNDTSKLDALLSAAEYVRYNLRETFDEDGFELVAQDDVPDSGFTFINVEQAGPELETAAANGLGLIAGAPVIGYSGKNLANRIIPLGVEWDGKQMGLDASDQLYPYPIRTGVHPNTLTYKYIEDLDSQDVYGVVELQYVRSDVKNPSDDAGTRLAAANVLYALAAAEMFKRKSEVTSFGASIANGYDIDALPGDRVRVRFRGTVRLFSGTFTYRDVDQDFLVVKRRDASTVAGVRDVAFTLTAPEVPLIAVNLPDAVPIPPPPGPVPEPPQHEDPNADDDGGGDGAPETPYDEAPPGDFPPEMPQTPEIPVLPPGVVRLPESMPPGGSYEPCCTNPPGEFTDGPIVPPLKGRGQNLGATAYSGASAMSVIGDPPGTLAMGLPNNATSDDLIAIIISKGVALPEVSTRVIPPGASVSTENIAITEPEPVTNGLYYAEILVFYVAPDPTEPVYFKASHGGVVGDNSTWVTQSLGVIQEDGSINWLTGNESATNTYSGNA